MTKPIQFYIFRHGVAVERGTSGYEDPKRPLTKKGSKEVKKVVKVLRDGGFDPDVILTSPFLRASKTAEITAEVLRKEKSLRYCMELVPGEPVIKLFKEMKKLTSKNRTVLLVGHEPHLSSFISFLISGQLKGSFLLKKTGICKVVFEKSLLNPGQGKLEWFLPPAMIRSLKKPDFS